MNSAKKLASALLTDYPKVLAYMWQSSDYRGAHFMKWWLRIDDFHVVQKRGTLVPTLAGNVVRAITGVITLLYLVLNTLSIWWFRAHLLVSVAVVIVALLAYPLIVALFTTIPVMLLRIIWVMPKQARAVSEASHIFKQHNGIVIAIAGSYGKTTMKELLAKALGSEKKVAFTEGNKNTMLSIARFATTLQGDEDIVIVELGEGASRDVEKMTNMVQPTYAVITGLAPNHLDGYKDIDDIAQDFAALCSYVGQDKAYINGDSPDLFEKLHTLGKTFTTAGCLNRWPTHIKLKVNHTSFQLEGCEETIHVSSGLVGMHNVGTLAFVAGFSRELGCGVEQLESALSETTPYEHRLEPRAFHGAWLIDDTYNGSIEGMKAGLALLSELKTKGKKIYVTPGLVDQGIETERVHAELGKAIAVAKPDELYLMRNSVEQFIESAVIESGYGGKIKVIDEPLKFYQHLETIVAKDDIVMCQNDWPDFYN